MVTPHRKTPDRVKIISAAVFAVALLVRLFYLYEVRTIPLMEHPSVDARAYHEWGLRIAMGDWWGDKVFYQAPAYPYLLGVLFRVGGHSLALVHVVQMIIGASSCVLIYLAGMAIFPGTCMKPPSLTAPQPGRPTGISTSPQLAQPS